MGGLSSRRRPAVQRAAGRAARWILPKRSEVAVLRGGGLLAVLFLLSTAAPTPAQLEVLETDDLRLVYFYPTLSHIAPYAARCVENALDFQTEIYGFDPPEKLTVLLKDFSDRGNAAAAAIPRNQLLYDVAPTDFSFETFVAPERLFMITNHELTHVTTMDLAARSDRAFRRLFRGKIIPLAEHPETLLYLYLTTPRFASPSWFKEGIAVFNETWMAAGIGRAQGSYDEMVFRSMVRDGSHFYDPLGLVSEGIKIDFQVGVNSYLYGTRFMSYLAHEYSPDHLVRWVRRGDGTRRYFAAEFERVFGLPMNQAWQDWIEFEHRFQEANLAKIREFPITPHEDLSDRALGSVSRAYLDAETGRLYAALRYPGTLAHIAAISLEDGSIEKLLDVKKPALYRVTSLAWDPLDKKIFYTTDHAAFRDLRILDPETREHRILLKDARIGDLVFNRADRSLWGVRHLNGIASLVRVPAPYDQWELIRSWPYGEVLYDLDLSPDGERVSVSVGLVDGRHLLRVFAVADLENGAVDQKDLTPITEVSFGTTIPMNFVFSADGRHLWGTSYLTGAANIFRVEIDSGERTVVCVGEGPCRAMTNAETGLFRPIPLDDDRLIVFRYTGAGFVPATLEVEPLTDINALDFLGHAVVKKYPALEDWKVDFPPDVDLESLITAEGGYDSFRRIGVESLYPVLEGYKDSLAGGFRLNLSDPIGLNRAHLVATYSSDAELASDERLHLELGFERYDFRASARLNDADFYDVFGPTKKSLKGYSLGLGWSRSLLYDEPRRLDFHVDGTFYGDLERLPGAQNVGVQFDELFELEARLEYENVRRSLGAVDDEKGVRWNLVLTDSYVNSESIEALRAAFDFGIPLRLSHSSLWLRTAAGRAWGDADDPFANFFFGGFGNNWVDRGKVQRYRLYDAFPGLEINEVGGRTFGKAMVEWSLPPVRFRRAGWQGFFMTWMRPSLFAAGLVTNPDDGAVERELSSVGAQLDFRLTVVSNLDLTLSVGYAMAEESGRPSSDEFMASLKIF